jgi:phenylalanyl-tRNA synthetase beta chain
MRYSHDWLSAFVPHGRNADAIRDLVSAHVATVDGVEQVRADLAPIVVARVVQASRHPNSDRLWVTRVDDGSGELLDVVCGAPNVTEGTLYPFARTGTVMPGGLRIEKRRIRGETSNGMLCSARELGLGEDHDGILALDVDVAPGTPFLEAVAVGDVRFDVDVLTNRPDLLCHLGMARELSAITGVPLRFPEELPLPPTRDSIEVGAPVSRAGAAAAAAADGVRVTLESLEECPQYVGMVIRDVRVAPSPGWLAHRVESVGLRSINNVVDATNYVLHAFGQPVHAFDLDTLEGRAIVVRPTRAGETLVTLDGAERRLAAGTTVICDAARPVALAGVMGGRDTEVTDRTTNVLLEVAWFDPRFVRRVRRAVGLSTDASYRFERMVDDTQVPEVALRAAALIAAVAGGRVTAMLQPTPAPAWMGTPVSVHPARVERLLGDRVEGTEIARLLAGIGFAVESRGDELSVVPPSWRRDVARDADLVEEVARLRGFDVLSDELKPFRPGTVPDHPLFLTSRRVRDVLVGAGMLETRPLPFVAGGEGTHARVLNPLAENEPYLRTSLLETLARGAEYNLSRMHGDLRLFEIGSVFHPRPGTALPHEEVHVGLLVMGARRPVHFTEPHPPAFDAWDAKGLAELVAHAAFPGEAIALEPTPDGADADLLWNVRVGDRRRGEVRRVALDRPAWASEPFGVELSLDVMSNAPVAPPGRQADIAPRAPMQGRAIAYRPLPTTPSAEFDLALVVADATPAAAVEELIRRSGGELLERVVLFDEFRGRGVPDGHRSLAWRLTFRDPVRTLRDKEVEGRRQRILKTLETELGVRPRLA